MEGIPRLPGVIEKCIPAHLQYTCVHWATHLRNSKQGSELLELMESFVKGKLTQAYEWWKEKVQQGVKEDVLEIKKDAYKLVLEFFLPIRIRPLEIYNSASIFAPHCKMKELYTDNKMANDNHTAVKLVTARNTTWDTCLGVIETGKCDVWCVEHSPDGGLIASVSYDGRVQIWDSGVGTLRNTLLGHTKAVRSIAWSPDGQWIVSGSSDKTWRVWNVGSGAEVTQQNIGRGVGQVAWHATGKQIASVANKGGLQVWDLEIGKAVKAVKTIPNIKDVKAISNDFAQFLDTIDETLRLWDTESGTIIRTIGGHTNSVNSAAFLNDTQMVSCGWDDTFVWDIATCHCVHSFGEGSWDISVSPKGDWIAAYGNRIIHIWDSHTWQDCGRLSIMPLSESRIDRYFSLSPNGERLVSASDSNLRLWDLTQPTSETRTMQSRILNIIFSPIHCYIAIVTKEIITIWSPRPYSGEPFCTLQGSFTEHAAFSPNAEKLALIDSNKRICVWRITTTPTLLYTSSLEFGWFEGIAWSLDGCWIASIIKDDDYNAQVCVFDAATDRLEKKLVVAIAVEGQDLFELSLDSTMIYVRWFRGEFLYSLKEGQEVDVGTFKWETNIDKSKFLAENGWVIRKEDGKKLCWIPASRRYTHEDLHDSKIAMWQGHNYFSIISDSGQLTILHIPDGLQI